MTKRTYPRSEQVARQGNVNYYKTWDSQDVAALNKAVAGYSGKVYAHNRMGFDPHNVGGSGISGRYGMTHRDYEAWRPDEASSFKDIKNLIIYSDMCYAKHGIVRN